MVVAGMKLKGFVGPAYAGISRAINAQRCVNLRLELDQANGKEPLSLVGLPGYSVLVATLPNAPVRGFWMADNRVFVAVGPELYELHADLTHTLRGLLSPTSTPVLMADNGLHLLAVDGAAVLALELATNEVTYSIENFPIGATHIACIDQTFIANAPDSQRFQISAVGDALTWSAIDFASAEAMPDNIVGLLSFGRQLYLLGTDTLQVFWNSGDATRPFVPIEGSTVEVGCAAPYSLAKDESGVYWLGRDKRGPSRVYKASGGQVAVVSTPALDVALRGYTTSDATAYTFRVDGSVFYALTFPTDDQTWVYDVGAGAWYEFLEWSVNEWLRHRSACTIHAFGRQIIGDFENGKLYEMSGDIYANGSAVQRALRSTAHVSQENSMLIVGSIEVLTEAGVGITVGQGSDPQMMLRTSRDGGATWSGPMMRPMGKKGEFGRRTRWNRPCGAARDIVFEISVTDPVKRVFLGAVVNQP